MNDKTTNHADRALRLKCLELAALVSRDGTGILTTAEAMLAFVEGVGGADRYDAKTATSRGIRGCTSDEAEAILRDPNAAMGRPLVPA